MAAQPDRCLWDFSSPRFARIVVWATAGLLCLFFVHLRFSMTHEWGDATGRMLAEGRAWRPFQYRILIPAIAGFLQRAIPAVSLESWYKLIELGALAGIFITLRGYLDTLFANPLASLILALSVFALLPFNYLFPHDRWYPWDLPGVLFMLAGLWLLREQRWRWYYPLFVVATLNRETSCFLTFAYVATNLGIRPVSRIALHAGAQLVLWLSIKWLLIRIFAENPGPGLFDTPIATNLQYLRHSWHWLFLGANMGFLWLPTLLLHRFIDDRFIARSLWVLLPFVAGMFVVGNIFEQRLFGELIPIVLPAFLLICRRLFLAKVS